MSFKFHGALGLAAIFQFGDSKSAVFKYLEDLYKLSDNGNIGRSNVAVCQQDCAAC
jgi:hypothetical protein